MRNIYIDFETYFDKDYSLKKMPTILYVRDPRFKTLGVSVAVEDETPRFLSDDEFRDWITRFDWGDVTAVAHNMLFDGLILAEHYGVHPVRYICTQALARAFLPVDSSSLKRVAEVLGLGAKGDALVAGSDVVGQDLIDYANNDVVLCRGIDKMLRPFLPEREQQLMSLTQRWGCVGMLHLNDRALEEAGELAIAERDAAIAASGQPESVLSSNQQFAALLRELGVVVPIKISQTTGEETEAFSKNDPEFQALMAEYPEHANLWLGRIAAKSNIAINRAEKMLQVARLGKGTLPMQLNYFGAHTGRWSGSGGLNAQNLPRGSALRTAIEAPPGYNLCVVDSAQIELRLNFWFCGQLDKHDVLAGGGDIYKLEAAEQLGKDLSEVTKTERQYGKVRQLGLGYGMGWKKYRMYCASGPLGMDPILLTQEEAFKDVTSYRGRHPRVVEMWDLLGSALPAMMLPNCDIPIGPVRLKYEAIELPNGMTLDYPGLRPNEQGGFTYGVDKKLKYIYGSKLLENIIQALARVAVADQILDIDEQYPTVSSTHDEALYLAPEAESDRALAFGIAAFSKTPDWAPGLVLSAEGGYAHNYSK